MGALAQTQPVDPLHFRRDWKRLNLHLKQEDDRFYGRLPLEPGTWLARKYRYADGKIHRESAYVLFYADRVTGEEHVVGGAVQLRLGEVLGYIGDINPAERISEIAPASHVRVYAYTLAEVFTLLKKKCPDPLKITSITHPPRVGESQA